MSGNIRIGISGWNYPPWRGRFYPPDLPHKRELAYAASQFRSIEINGTFYSLQRPTSFAKWFDETPEDFVFSVKGSRYITHMLRLRGVEGALANFFASGLLQLGAKLGPILWQFPPNFAFDAERFAAFLELLPHDTHAASAVAEQHDRRLDGRAWTGVGAAKRRTVRHAVEIRHPSFVCEAFIRILRRHNVALVCADTVAWPRLMDVTADFVYCRLHGSKVLYTSGYSGSDIAEWAMRVAAWANGGQSADGDRASTKPGPRRKQRDVYVYFDNDVKVHAPRDARSVQRSVDEQMAGES